MGEIGKISSLEMGEIGEISSLEMGEIGEISSLPFTRGGLGWGNLRNNSNQITCVYTVVSKGRGLDFLLSPKYIGGTKGGK
jgi:hypothetical protein